jgi:hypothetical protein
VEQRTQTETIVYRSVARTRKVCPSAERLWKLLLAALLLQWMVGAAVVGGRRCGTADTDGDNSLQVCG